MFRLGKGGEGERNSLVGGVMQFGSKRELGAKFVEEKSPNKVPRFTETKVKHGGICPPRIK